MTTRRTRAVYDHPAAMEPMLPEDKSGKLQELATTLLQKSAALGSAVHPVTRVGIVDLVRNMNSYYSNLIEGHNTHPADIEKALRKDYSADPARRALQIESRAHVEVQRLIEQRLVETDIDICSADFICWIHQEWYKRLPDEFCIVKTKAGKEDRVTPGQLRTCEVEVGQHTAPTWKSLPALLARFQEAYRPEQYDPITRIIAIAASHHRLAWIHPFLDGNGRVIRLLTHAYLQKANIDGHGLWTVSRGLARRRDDYRAVLAGADQPRSNDLDGRGNLSNEGLAAFCRFFLETAVDQVEFMSGLLELDGIQRRIMAYVEREATITRFPAQASVLLRDCYLRGEIPRREAGPIMRMPERTARRVLGRLLEEGLLAAEGPKKPLRLGFPIHAVGYYFPRLYPEGVELSGSKD